MKTWRWVGLYVSRKGHEVITKMALRWTWDCRNERGKQKETWRRMVETEMKELEKTWKDFEKKAKDRQMRRILVGALCVDRQGEAHEYSRIVHDCVF